MLKKFLVLIICCVSVSSAFSKEKLTVMLDWFMNPIHAPLIVAEQQGFFADENLQVDFIAPADPNDPPKLVAAKKADVALTYEPQFIEQVEQGLPLIRIGSLIDQPLNCLAVLADSPIKNLSDLKNKKIGKSSGSLASLTLKTMLASQGIALSEVEAINVHYDLSQALLTKKIDAVTGLMRTYEVIQMDLAHHPVRIFLPEQYGLPLYEELIFVVNKDTVHDPRYLRFLTAVKRGRDYLLLHPEETWTVFAKQYPLLNNELNHRAWLATLPYFAKDPLFFDPIKFSKFVRFMRREHLISGSHSLQDYTFMGR